MKIKVLEGQSGILRILVYLCKSKGPASLTAIMKGIGVTQVALYNSLRKAVESGLVIEHKESKFPRRKTITLTDKGQRIAKLLLEIDQNL